MEVAEVGGGVWRWEELVVHMGERASLGEVVEVGSQLVEGTVIDSVCRIGRLEDRKESLMCRMLRRNDWLRALAMLEKKRLRRFMDLNLP